MKIQSLVLEI